MTLFLLPCTSDDNAFLAAFWSCLSCCLVFLAAFWFGSICTEATQDGDSGALALC